MALERAAGIRGMWNFLQNNNEVLLGIKHHGLLFSDKLMDRVAAGGGAVNLAARQSLDKAKKD